MDINDKSLPDLLDFIEKNCTLAPNKTLYVKKNLKLGILPIILEELLLTRIMIKNSIKRHKFEKNSQNYKTLHNRQLGLKLLANVTYGYTSAGFSGRMPSCELADSIVSIGQETLQKAMSIVEGNKNWNAKVVYGDTDSLFVLLEGRSPEVAIKIGKEIADCVTKSNPEPIKLQFEKIYSPLLILSKKHYAGYKYEDFGQINNNKNKILESKGIETVRRDTCEVNSKILEKALKIIFEKKDLSFLKNYLYRSFDKIITGKSIIKDFIFAKEVRLGTYKGGILPPSAQIAYSKHLKDPNYLPRYKEREPYLVVVNQNGSKRLKDCIMSPEDFFNNKNVFLNTNYYIEKHILPTINRILEPIGVDVYGWYSKYPRPKKNFDNVYFSNSNTSNMNRVGDNLPNLLSSNDVNSDNYSKKSTFKTLNDYLDFRKKNSRENFINENEWDTLNEKEKLIIKSFTDNNLEKKKHEYLKICLFCSELDKFNLPTTFDIPCKMYQCKIYYDKLLCDYKLNSK